MGRVDGETAGRCPGWGSASYAASSLHRHVNAPWAIARHHLFMKRLSACRCGT